MGVESVPHDYKGRNSFSNTEKHLQGRSHTFQTSHLRRQAQTKLCVVVWWMCRGGLPDANQSHTYNASVQCIFSFISFSGNQYLRQTSERMNYGAFSEAAEGWKGVTCRPASLEGRSPCLLSLPCGLLRSALIYYAVSHCAHYQQSWLASLSKLITESVLWACVSSHLCPMPWWMLGEWG